MADAAVDRRRARGEATRERLMAAARELDEEHSLGGLRAGMLRLEREGRIPAGEAELLAHILLAALNEAALLLTAAEDQRAAADTARRALDTLLDRLCGPTRGYNL